MNKLIGHLRGNAIGYLALFVALGGTGYAAASIPRNSVGSPQLRNGSVIPAKLDARSIPGYLAFWARIDQNGHVLASSAPITTSKWSTGIGSIAFDRKTPGNCFPLANIAAGAPPGAYVSFTSSSTTAAGTGLTIATNAPGGAVGPEPVDVAEVCP